MSFLWSDNVSPNILLFLLTCEFKLPLLFVASKFKLCNFIESTCKLFKYLQPWTLHALSCSYQLMSSNNPLFITPFGINLCTLIHHYVPTPWESWSICCVKPCMLECGVSQGTVLRPPSFFVYMYNLTDNEPKFTLFDCVCYHEIMATEDMKDTDCSGCWTMKWYSSFQPRISNMMLTWKRIKEIYAWRKNPYITNLLGENFGLISMVTGPGE